MAKIEEFFPEWFEEPDQEAVESKPKFRTPTTQKESEEEKSQKYFANISSYFSEDEIERMKEIPIFVFQSTPRKVNSAKRKLSPIFPKSEFIDIGDYNEKFAQEKIQSHIDDGFCVVFRNGINHGVSYSLKTIGVSAGHEKLIFVSKIEAYHEIARRVLEKFNAFEKSLN